MDMVPVTSSNLRAVGYDADEGILRVAFNDGGIYDYLRVPEQIYRALMAAGSKGQFFNASIKNNFTWRKVA